MHACVRALHEIKPLIRMEPLTKSQCKSNRNALFDKMIAIRLQWLRFLSLNRSLKIVNRRMKLDFSRYSLKCVKQVN